MKSDLLLTLFVLVACGGGAHDASDASSGAGGSLGSSTSGSPHASGSSSSAPSASSTSTSGVASSASSTTSSSSSSGTGGSGSGPNPPAGTTLCGKGKVSAMDVVTACQTAYPSMITGAPSMDCSAATTSGAMWQAWCGAGSLQYLWVDFEGAYATSSPSSLCSINSNPEATYAAMGGVVGSYGGIESSNWWFVTNTAADLVVEYSLQLFASSGSGNLWLGGELECGPSPMTMSNVTLLGLAFTWQA